MDAATIILLDHRHIKALAALERACFSAPWSEDDFAAALELPHFTVLGIMDEAGLAAYISLSHPAGDMEVLNLATREDARRHGLARLLLEKALDLTSPLGTGQVFLEVRESNIPAQNLYSSLGFRQCGRRRSYYRDSGEDALVLCRSSAGENADA